MEKSEGEWDQEVIDFPGSKIDWESLMHTPQSLEFKRHFLGEWVNPREDSDSVDAIRTQQELVQKLDDLAFDEGLYKRQKKKERPDENRD